MASIDEETDLFRWVCVFVNSEYDVRACVCEMFERLWHEYVVILVLLCSFFFCILRLDNICVISWDRV